MSSERPPFAVQPEVMAVLEVLWRHGHAAYLVGGGVRDALLGLPGTDWDVATDARPERILRLFPGASYENRFGTVLARGLEITTFRREHRYADHRRPDSVTFSDDIYEDLARRDLTINAIAWGSRGRGHATPAGGSRGWPGRPGRAPRACGGRSRRAASTRTPCGSCAPCASRRASGFHIEPVTRAAVIAHAADVAWVSEERIGAEVRRMLAIERPSRAFRLLHETNLLAAVLPELDLLARDDAAAGPSGSADRFERSLEALDRMSVRLPGDERLAWAALFGEAGPAAARTALDRLRVASREREVVCLLIAQAHVALPGDAPDADLRRFMGHLPAEQLDDLLVLAGGSRRRWPVPRPSNVRPGCGMRILAQRRSGVPLTLADLAIDGRDLQATLGIPEGPLVGRILEALLADVLDDPSLNGRVTLLTRAALVLDERMQGGSMGPA